MRTTIDLFIDGEFSFRRSSSHRTSFSSFSRCTGSSVKVTVDTEGMAPVSRVRKLEEEKQRRGRGEHNCAHNNGLCFRGGAERRSVNGARYFAGLGIDSLRDCLAELTLRSGYLNALFGETKLEFRTILLDGVSHCPRLCVAAASLSLLILVCYRQQWFYDSYVGNAPGIRTHSIGTYYSDRWMDT